MMGVVIEEKRKYAVSCVEIVESVSSGLWTTAHQIMVILVVIVIDVASVLMQRTIVN